MSGTIQSEETNKVEMKEAPAMKRELEEPAMEGEAERPAMKLEDLVLGEEEIAAMEGEAEIPAVKLDDLLFFGEEERAAMMKLMDDSWSDSDTDTSVVNDHSHYAEYDYDESDGDYVDEESGAVQSEETNKGEMKEEPAMKVELEGPAVILEDASRKVPPSRRRGTCSWVKPRRQCYRVDTGGSVKRGKEGGYGAIIRDSNGVFIDAAYGVSGIPSVLYNKVLGVKLGLELAKKHNLKDVEVSTTSRFISFLVTGEREPYDEDVATLSPILNEIYALHDCFDELNFFQSFRGCNQAAEYISKLFKEDGEINYKFHARLVQIMREDSAGVSYPCLF